MEAVAEKRAIKGGEFIVRETEAHEIFVPEEFGEEQRMMAKACRDFLEQEIFPNVARIEKREEGLMQSLLEKAGELGLLSVTVPRNTKDWE